MSDDTIRKLRNLGPLHDLLLTSCPPDAQGVKSIAILADALDCSAAAIYGWIQRNKIPAEKAKAIVDLGAGVSLDQFHKYVYTS